MLDRLSIKYFKLSVGTENIGKETNNDLAARCPICGDSKKNKHTKRLHLYNKGSSDTDFVNCFNGDCACQNKPMGAFLKQFFPHLLDRYKKEKFTETMLKLGDESSDDVFSQFNSESNTGSNTKNNAPVDSSDSLTLSNSLGFDDWCDTDNSEIAKSSNLPNLPDLNEPDIVTQDLSSFFTPIENSPEALQYLNNRGIKYNGDFGKWYFGHQDLKIGDILYKITNAIIIPLYFKNEMYGFYSRNIHEKTFYTYMHDSNIGFKVAFWFNIDKSKPVYLFEAIFDGISSGKTNIAAFLGAKIPNERIAELREPVFVLDNDKTGILNMIEYAKQGHKVFIQPDKYNEKDINSLKLNHPDLNISKLIDDNLFSGISAIIRLKNKL